MNCEIGGATSALRTGPGTIEKKNRRFSGIHSVARKPVAPAALGFASAVLAGSAVAQEVLPTIDVSGQGQGEPVNALQASTGIARLPGTVQDIPQTVNVISQQTLQQQGVTTLDQALRNVPGVTVSSGEGNGGMNGDQFRIRGFQAKGDVYVDGLRDFGNYTRDAFSIEQIQVLKGPSSESFGYGTTGGAINLEQKKAKLDNFTDVEGTLGTGPLARAVADINRQLDDTTAMRIVGMYHNQDIVDRDNLYADRWGILGSIGFGLGASTSLTLNYLHQDGNRRPDMGTPIAQTNLPGVIGKPVTEYGVPRNLFFGMNTDADRSKVDMFTAKFKHELTSWLTVHNDTRVAYYDRYFAQTATVCDATCANAVIGGSLNVPYGFSGGAGYVQSTNGAQNVTTAVAKFNTGALRHEAIAGIDINQQKDQRTALANSATKLAGTILDPAYINNGSVYENPLAANGLKKADSFNIGIFGSDRVWLTDQFSILGGARWDRFDSNYSRTAAGGVWLPELKSGTEFVSPKASVIWEPTKEQTYYVTWSRSYSNLAGQFVSMDPNVIGVNPGNDTVQPEQNDLWEAGLKWNLMNGRLGFTAALFQVTKGNSVQTDPVSGDLLQTNEKQRVQGVEFGLTGKITDDWDVQAAYAYMDSEILSATVANAATVGHRVAYVPTNAASLWTTYNVAPMFKVPGKLLVGGGMFYTDSYFVNSLSTAEVPAQTTYNLMVSYEYQKYRLALNVINLTDEVAYDSAFGTRAVLAAGRTITLTAGVRW